MIPKGRTIWIADAHRGDGKRFIVRADEKLSGCAFRRRQRTIATKCELGLIGAALGRKEDALREGRRAIELLPVEKDSIDGSAMLVYFAVIAAWAGEKDLALQYLEANGQSQGRPGVATYGALKLLPFWDPLRGDPRFEKIVASLAPK